MTPTIETAIRLIVIGQDLLIATLFLSGKGGRAARLSGSLLMLGIVSYLYVSDDALRNSIPLLSPFAELLAMIVPFCLWLFARAVFEAPWPKRELLYPVVLVGILVVAIEFIDQPLGSDLTIIAGIIRRVLLLLVVAHAVWLTIKGRPDDLIERRRTFRLFFVVIVSMQIAAVLIVELVLGGAMRPGWLELTNVVIIAALTLGLAIPMLRLNAEFFEPEVAAAAVSADEAVNMLGAADDLLREKLLALMGSDYYQETGLTIPVLASTLGYPEHQLRRLINGHLGYRNFSAFLNTYRIREARNQLVDPERARIPVLTIALELGYASIGPFNRAFKTETGMTPTDYRRQNMSSADADSE